MRHSSARIIPLLLLAIGSFTPSARAQAITTAQLAGPWQISLVGNTGCGRTSLLFTGTLNASGTAIGTLTGTSGCGGPSSSTQTFTITSLNAHGNGTANLSCGSGCGWNFNIQVAANEQAFNMVDVSDGAANALTGIAVAVPQSAPPITVAELAGPWQISIAGNTGCGQTSMLFTGTLNASGVANGTLATVSECVWSVYFGESSTPQTFTITSLNANGSGTAALSCGADCGWNFNIQVAANKQVFDLVDTNDRSANVLAGTAVAVPESAAPITLAQLAGPWQIAVVGDDNVDCGTESMLFTGTLYSTGTATGPFTRVSQWCGTTTTTETLTVTSLDSNGFGTVTLDGYDFDIQVAPDKQVFNMVGGSAVGEGGPNTFFQVYGGTAVAEPGFVIVPDVLGDTFAQATTAVQDAGLRLTPTGTRDYPYVTAQTPAPGTWAPVGSTVTVTFYINLR